MAYRKEDILAAAREIRAYLEDLVGEKDAARIRTRLDKLIAGADSDPKAGTRILALLRPYAPASQWMSQELDRISLQHWAPTEQLRSREKYIRFPGESASDTAEERDRAEGVPEASDVRDGESDREAKPKPHTDSGGHPGLLDDGDGEYGDGDGDGNGGDHEEDILFLEGDVDFDLYVADDYEPLYRAVRPNIGEPSLGTGAGNSAPAPSPEDVAPRREQRFFRAELEDQPANQPLVKNEQYTAAFSVGPSSGPAIGESEFPDETLDAADKSIEIFDLTVQLDSDDFEIFGQATRPLRVPRTGRSLGKARFEVAPRRNGDCRLAASVHYQGNFVHQMELSIPVGVAEEAPVAVSTRGRPPESTAELKPRDIALLVEPASPQGFSCTALGSVGGRAVLPITAMELAAAVDAARKAMMTVISTRSRDGELVFQTGIDIPPEEQQAALRTLARAGALLFQHLFLHPAAGADARRVGEWLRGYAMNPGLRLNIQIFADHAPLPWAMLYLGDAAEGAQLSWDSFLGMRHIVEQLPLQMSLGTVDNEILSTPKLAVSVNVNTSIDRPPNITLVADHQKHWDKTATDRTGLALLSRLRKSEVVRALADSRTADQVVYFYCHATAGKSDPDQAAIIMGRKDAATVADLKIDAPTTVLLPGNPLVFINACESAGLSPLFYNGFVPYFMAKGARGVIGTECKTPAIFAAEWANAFFDRFLDGATVGETVLELRRSFLRDHGNPLGLIYAVHCDADTRIAPALTHAKRRGRPGSRNGA